MAAVKFTMTLTPEEFKALAGAITDAAQLEQALPLEARLRDRLWKRIKAAYYAAGGEHPYREGR